LKRLAALFEVLGVYLAAGVVADKLAKLMVRWRLGAVDDPFALITPKCDECGSAAGDSAVDGALGAAVWILFFVDCSTELVVSAAGA
jgi:hypothetical protein